MSAYNYNAKLLTFTFKLHCDEKIMHLEQFEYSYNGQCQYVALTQGKGTVSLLLNILRQVVHVTKSDVEKAGYRTQHSKSYSINKLAMQLQDSAFKKLHLQ